MAKGNRNKRCEACGKRHNEEKPCKLTAGTPEPTGPGDQPAITA